MSQRSWERPREKTEVDKSIDWLNSLPFCYCEKRHGNIYQKTGNPDITGSIKVDGVGVRIEIEMKRPGENPTKKQLEMLKRWGDTGCIVGVAWSLCDVQEIMAPYVVGA